MTNRIHQEVSISASRQIIFDALTSASQFGEFTNSPAEIDSSPGGQFSCFDGMITGQTIELIPGVRIVQAWRVGNWDPGIYSIVSFVFEEVSESETKLIFDHTGFPEGNRDDLDQGWHKMYWEPLKKHLNA